MSIPIQHAKFWHFQGSNPDPLVVDKKGYKIAQASLEDKRRVAHWYYSHPVPNMTIKTIEAIHCPGLEKIFEARLALLEKRHSSNDFAPTWRNNGSSKEKKQRQAITQLLEKMCQDYKDSDYKHVKILPAWHGTSDEKMKIIAATGFANLAEKDPGYLGKGLYVTDEPLYAQLYSKGVLIVSWVSLYSAFPVIFSDFIGEKGGHTEYKLLGEGNKANYDAHFALMASVKPSDPKHTVYHPVQEVSGHTVTELVVFESAQVLPRYRVVLEEEISAQLGQFPGTDTSHLVIALLKLSLKLPEKSPLANSIERKIAYYRKFQRPLSNQEHRFFIFVQHYLDPQREKDKEAAMQLINSFLDEGVSSVGEEEKVYIPEDNASDLEFRNYIASQPKLQNHFDHLKGIHEYPEDSKYYFNLFRALRRDEEILLPNHQQRNKLKVLLEVLRWDPSYAFPSQKLFKLPNGRHVSKKELCLEILKGDPEYSTAYSTLATTLFTSEETVLLPDDRELTQKQLYLEAIKCEPQNSYAYVGLATLLTCSEQVAIQGHLMDKQTLLLKANNLSPRNSFAYCHLALTMTDDATLTLVSQRKMNKKELLLEAIRLNPQNIEALNFLADSLGQDNIQLPGEVQHQGRHDLYLRVLLSNPTDTHAYNGIGCSLLGEGRIELPNNRKMTKQELFLEALKYNPKCSKSLCNLANTLQPNASIKLPDQKVINQQELYAKAIYLDPNNFLAYCYLAATLKYREKVKLGDGNQFTKLGLIQKALEINPFISPQYFYLEALKHDAEDPDIYFALGTRLLLDSTISLPNKEEVDERALYLECLKRDPQYAKAYHNLGFILKAEENIELPDHRTMTEKSLYLEAINLDPKLSLSYQNLGCLLASDATIKLHDGRIMNKKALFIESIKCDPVNSKAYYNLGNSLERDEEIPLPDGRKLGEQHLYVEAIRLDSSLPQAYHNLGVILAPIQGKIQLPDKRIMKEQEFYIEAIKLDPQHAISYYNLGLTLEQDESCKLSDGRVVRQQDLFNEAKRLDPKRNFLSE